MTKIQEILARAAFHGHGHIQDPLSAIIESGMGADAFMQRVKPHRIIGRLARRFDHASSEASRAAPDVSAFVFERQAYIDLRGERFIEEIVRLQHHLTHTGHPSLLLKGPSIHLVSRGRAPLRFFGDIDLLIAGTSRSDASAVSTPLAQLGYEHIPQWPCGIHEAGHFVYGDSAANFRLGGGGISSEAFRLDVHCGFPAWGYPDVEEADLARPGRIDLDRRGTGSSIDQALIGYEQFSTETCEVDTSFGRITTLGVEANALVSCANVFKDAFKPHWHQRTTVPLGDVAEVLDLTELPEFDIDRFQELARQWSMVDAVSFVADICRAYTGSCPEVLRTSGFGRASNYVTIWNRDHHPVVVRADRDLTTLDDRIARNHTMADQAESLGAAVAILNADGTATDVLPKGVGNVRTFTHRIRDRKLDMSVTLAWGEEALFADFHISTGPMLGSACVLLNFGDPAFEFYRTREGTRARVRNRADSGPRVAEMTSAEWHVHDDGASKLTVRIPWSVMTHNSETIDELGFICGLQDHVPHDPGQNASVFAPVRVVKHDARTHFIPLK